MKDIDKEKGKWYPDTKNFNKSENRQEKSNKTQKKDKNILQKRLDMDLFK